MAQLTARSCRSWKRARRPATAAPNLAWSCNALCCAVQDDQRRPLRLRRSGISQWLGFEVQPFFQAPVVRPALMPRSTLIPRRCSLHELAAAQPWTMGLPEDSFPSARWSAEGVNLEEARPIAVAGCCTLRASIELDARAEKFQGPKLNFFSFGEKKSCCKTSRTSHCRDRGGQLHLFPGRRFGQLGHGCADCAPCNARWRCRAPCDYRPTRCV